ncbi:O-acetyl-ADP-ribose deacetylase (regulator of RNase III), contains Macro domain [Lentibacillus persicus]|uniref:O-acetyl-ADP-ribose deacetylase (Regulator of RNase III), contains Macro domain n=1 Tax=Lentibacillus persicus TaxID=640948 RepID=A0A1I1UHK2_9BACI|nr:O-acetyl-ADP-ribose deacetylase [Lentibacillus persicus]SFD70321.1 O-acetyl-ADP-ribose deacetylase (regulator of RNase III), contains Macro domain [Lentibacillus persicus]
MKIELNGNTLELMTGDITQQETDVIVNAANGTLMGGGGVDGAIHRAAGKDLLKECKQVREKQLNGEKLPTGKAVLTRGHNLPASYVIHTVGPVWNERVNNQEEQLADCYRNALKIASGEEASSIAFPSISTGVYSFPIELAAETAIKTIADFLSDHHFGHVTIVLFSDNDYEAYAAALKSFTND